MRMFDYYGPEAPQGTFAAVTGRGMATRQVVIQSRLNRVLAFTRLTINDVVNSRLAKNQVLGYYKLSKQIDRSGEIGELERQWNPNGRA